MGRVKEHKKLINNPNCNSDQSHAVKKYIGPMERQGTRKDLQQENMTLFCQWEAQILHPSPM